MHLHTFTHFLEPCFKNFSLILTAQFIGPFLWFMSFTGDNDGENMLQEIGSTQFIQLHPYSRECGSFSWVPGPTFQHQRVSVKEQNISGFKQIQQIQKLKIQKKNKLQFVIVQHQWLPQMVVCFQMVKQTQVGHISIWKFSKSVNLPKQNTKGPL